MSLVRQTTRSMQAGFHTNTLKHAGTILAGNVGATFFQDRLAGVVPMIRSNPLFEVGSLLALAGLQAFVVKKFIPKILNANDILIGGILAGVTRGVKAIIPGHFTTCGLGEDMEGLGDDLEGLGAWFATPRSIGSAFALRGYASPQAPTIGTHGLGDEAVFNQIQGNMGHNLVTLDGMANDEVGREIAMQM